jgi:glyceraldehyde-3-phosphate dehydrogenase/erythrose-4-phosphate dehydrogenase
MVLKLKKDVTKEELNKVLKDASDTFLEGVMGYTEEPIVLLILSVIRIHLL